VTARDPLCEGSTREAAPQAPAGIVAATAAALGVPCGGLEWRWLGAREGPTSLWWVEGGAAAAVVKVFWRGRGFLQERAALLRLGPALGRWLPALVAVIEGPMPALVIEALAGQRPRAGEEELAAHFEAGRLVRALAAVEVVEDSMPLEVAIAARAAATLRRARGVVAREVAEAAAARLDPGRIAAVFSGARRVMAHRDLWADNWLFDQVSGRLRVIDWEHARADAVMTDRVRLAAGAWARAPALKVAFEAGFGAGLSEVEAAQLEVLVGLHALATLVWAERRGAAALGADARMVLGLGV